LLRASKPLVNNTGVELQSPYGKLWVNRLASANRQGAAKPAALICLHPTPFDGSYFAEFAQRFDGKRDVWAPDYPGYGRSDPPAQAASIDDYARALLSAPEGPLAGEPEKPPHLLGFHTGCLVACEIALQAPDRIGDLILIDVPYFTGAEQLQKYRENFDGSAKSQGFGATFSYPCADKLLQVRNRVLVIASGSSLSEPSHETAGVIPNAQLKDLPQVSRPVFKTGGKLIANLVDSFLHN